MYVEDLNYNNMQHTVSIIYYNNIQDLNYNNVQHILSPYIYRVYMESSDSGSVFMVLPS